MVRKIYPVNKTENKCEDYKIKINRKQVELDTAILGQTAGLACGLASLMLLNI